MKHQKEKFTLFPKFSFQQDNREQKSFIFSKGSLELFYFLGDFGDIFKQRGTYAIKTCYNIFFTLVQQWATHSIKAYTVFLKSNIGYS